MKTDFYVYALLDPRKPGTYKYGKWKFTHEPFYIGKGFGRRAETHLRAGDQRAYEKHVRSNHKVNKIRKMQREGHEPIIRYAKTKLDEATAFTYEIQLIAKIGLKRDGGPLTNATAGGEGVSGYVGDELHRKRKSQAAKAWYATLSDEEKEVLIRNRAYALKECLAARPEGKKQAHYKAVSEGHKKRNPEQQKELSKKFSEIQRNLPEDVDIPRRAKLSKAGKERFANMSEEDRAVFSAKTGAGIKRSWDETSQPKRKQRVRNVANARHYEKDASELEEINGKIADTVKSYHAGLSLYEKRIRNFRVMCATRLSLIGRKDDDDLRKRLYGIGDRFYAKQQNLKVEPTQLRDRVVRMIEKRVA